MFKGTLRVAVRIGLRVESVNSTSQFYPVLQFSIDSKGVETIPGCWVSSDKRLQVVRKMDEHGMFFF